MKTFNPNRPLEILCIHSQLICSNDVKQKLNFMLVRNDKRDTLESLTLAAQQLELVKGIQTDLEYWDSEGVMN